MVTVDVTGIPELKALVKKLEFTTRSPLLGRTIAEIASNAARQRIRSGNADDPLASWAPLSEEYAHRAEKGSILNRTGALCASIGYDLSRWHYGEIKLTAGGRSLNAGKNVSYAGTHQYGLPKKNVPARPFLGLSAKSIKEVTAEIGKILDRAGK